MYFSHLLHINSSFLVRFRPHLRSHYIKKTFIQTQIKVSVSLTLSYDLSNDYDTLLLIAKYTGISLFIVMCLICEGLSFFASFNIDDPQIIIIFCYCCSAREGSQDLTHAGQLLYHWASLQEFTYRFWVYSDMKAMCIQENLYLELILSLAGVMWYEFNRTGQWHLWATIPSQIHDDKEENADSLLHNIMCYIQKIIL
jgi:hypothetical protein